MKTDTENAQATRGLLAQEHLLPFLLNPRSYHHRTERVRLVQTHSSFVFLTGRFVYKVKKPVNFGFLDFSTLEKRRHFCEREVALNRRLCPDVYLGVVPISIRDGNFTFGAGEQVVEYAVKMRKLAGGHFLDQLVRKGAAGAADLDRIAVALARFYRAQDPAAEVEEWGRIARLRISTDENFRQTARFVGPAGAFTLPVSVGARAGGDVGREGGGCPTLSRPAWEAIRFYTAEVYTRQRSLFASRVRNRWIRDCHGDLHLEHIHVTRRSLHIYDCIEFNDRLRYVDVASDVAFLAMDLDHQGRPDLARHFVERMAVELDDREMLRLVDFYKCYRAFVRGKVESLHSVAHAAPDEERRASVEEARRYFRLALQYAVAGSRRPVLAVMGRIASGKSTLAAGLGAELGWPVFSSDRVRKDLAGFPLYERSSAAARRRLYSAAMTRQTYDRLFEAAEAGIRSGQGVLLDATFARREDRDALRERFRTGGVPVVFVEAVAGDVTIRRRLLARERQPDAISDARLEDFDLLTGIYRPPDELPAGGCVRVRTATALEQTLTRALSGLARLQARFAGRAS